jgi:hypothetical protein
MRLAFHKLTLVLSLSKDGRAHQAVLRQTQHGDNSGCCSQLERVAP